MNNILKKNLELIPIFFLVLILGFFYFKTIAPGLTWANNGADGGDFVSAAATGGVAHPPGYPFYLTIARIFQLLPIKSIAFRTNLLSLICTIAASIIIFKLAERNSQASSYNWLIGLSTSLAFGLSQLVWSQAVITEVYALQELLLVSFLFVLSIGKTDSKNSSCLDIILGLLLGLAIQNHLTAVFFLPFVFLIGIITKNTEKSGDLEINNRILKKLSYFRINWKPLFIRCLAIIISLLFTLTIFVRANSGSPVIWGDPKTINNFLWLLTGKMYSGSLLNFSFEFLLTRIHLWGTILKNQIGIIGLIIAVIGFVLNGSKSNPKTIFTLWIFISFFIFSLLFNSIDSYIYIIFSMIAISIWFGWGVESIIGFFDKRKGFQICVAVLMILYLIGQGLNTYSKVDASHDTRAEDFGTKVMTEVPREAIIFTDADKDSFSLWYFQYVLKERPDISIVVDKLLPYGWYRHSLNSVYPLLIIPEKNNGSWQRTIMDQNPNHVYCSTIVIEEAYLNCKK